MKINLVTINLLYKLIAFQSFFLMVFFSIYCCKFIVALMALSYFLLNVCIFAKWWRNNSFSQIQIDHFLGIKVHGSENAEFNFDHKILICFYSGKVSQVNCLECPFGNLFGSSTKNSIKFWDRKKNVDVIFSQFRLEKIPFFCLLGIYLDTVIWHIHAKQF